MLRHALAAIALYSAPTVVDERAELIADAVLERVGGQENWDQARFIRFTFVRRNRSPQFTWDRWTGRLRIESKNDAGVPYVVLMNVKTRQGKVVVEGRALSGRELSEYLNRAYAMWTGETYWLLMPFKWKDPGVNLSYDGEERIDGVTYDKVHLTFDDVGRSPGDQYWAYVNRETHLMDRFRFKLQGGAEGTYRWTKWFRYGGLLIATERASDTEVIRFEDILVTDTMEDEVFTSAKPVSLP